MIIGIVYSVIAFAITWPSAVPSGEISGGILMSVFNKILVDTGSTTDGTVRKAQTLINQNCGVGKAIQGFTNTGAIICGTIGTAYTVTFNGNGGTGHSPATKVVIGGTAIGTLPSDPTRVGYTFNGWYTSTTGGSQVTTATIVNADVTLYAQWSEVVVYYTVTFNGNGGTGHNPATKVVPGGTAIGTLPSNPTRALYEFNGWYTSITGGSKVTVATIVNADVTLYAQWSLLDVYGSTTDITPITRYLSIPGVDTCDGNKGSVSLTTPCWLGNLPNGHNINNYGIYTCAYGESKSCTDIFLGDDTSWCTNNDDGSSNYTNTFRVFSRSITCNP